MATAKLVMNGSIQAVLLPTEFRFKGEQVNIRRDEQTGEVILSEKPVRTGSWDAFFEAAAAIPPEELEGFLEDRDHGVQERDDPLG